MSSLRTLRVTAVSVVLASGAASALGQGCILARSPEQSGLPTNQGGVLQPGHFQLTVGERHQYSFQHYVGDVYQESRAQAKTQVQNRINLVTVNLTYQVTPRVSVEVDAPWLFASRKGESSPIEYQSSGFGDTIIGVNSWILNPTHAHRFNASLGVGLYIPSGNSNYKNTVNTNVSGTGAATIVTAPVDYSIQPGTGGWGGVLQWMAYGRVGHGLTFYTDGDYIGLQGGTNGTQRATSTTTPLNNFNSVADQYLLEAGVQFPIRKLSGESTELSVTVGPRWEGVPATNLLSSDNDGFRRPGYAVSVGPGLQYSVAGNILTAGIAKAIHRDRTGSYPDSVYGTHGDAAFAQYVWLASYTKRF